MSYIVCKVERFVLTKRILLLYYYYILSRKLFSAICYPEFLVCYLVLPGDT